MTPPRPDAPTENITPSADATADPKAKANSNANGGAPAEAAEGENESAGTVIVAGLVNLGIAVAKLIGGLISASSAMLSEAAHSFADTVTEVLLFVALKRGEKPPDEKHPFGYGRETYFWAFIASLMTFLVGAGFSPRLSATNRNTSVTVSATECAASESIAEEWLIRPPISFATAMARLARPATMTVPVDSPPDS